MDGLYYVKKDNSIIFSTQLEPIYARKVFPCFDEPKFKSKFNITIESDKNKTFLSNMPEKSNTIANNNKISLNWFRFYFNKWYWNNKRHRFHNSRKIF